MNRKSLNEGERHPETVAVVPFSGCSEQSRLSFMGARAKRRNDKDSLARWISHGSCMAKPLRKLETTRCPACDILLHLPSPTFALRCETNNNEHEQFHCRLHLQRHSSAALHDTINPASHEKGVLLHVRVTV